MANGGNGRAKITVFSDYVCPFCYLEELDLARVREEFGDGVEVDWRAYELRPDPIPTLDPDGEYLHRVWNASVYPMARSLGMTLCLPPVQPRSRKALEAAEFARERGRHDAMHDAPFQAFFEEARDIGDVEVLLDVGGSVGLGREGLRLALDKGRYTEKVVSDGRLATARRGLRADDVRDARGHASGSSREDHGRQLYGGRVEAAVRKALGRNKE
jgi:predicted DsbA family dithiol-disulfide isomerase